MSRPTAIVVGVGAEEGIGAAVCRRFAAGGHHVLVAGRTPAKVERVAAAVREHGGSADPVTIDSTSEREVIALFERAELGPLDGERAHAVVFNAAALNVPRDFRILSAEQFEDTWRQNCFAGFLVGREAARRLLPLGRGSIFFTGASGSLRGRPAFAQFAAAKSGLRMVAQSMAREFGPQGVHVAHVIIDGGVDGQRLKSALPQIAEQRGANGLLGVDAIAENYWHIHRQPPSAWTHEIDLRPFKEPF